MSSTSLDSPLPPVGTLYSAYYYGTIASTAFYGVACMQTFLYYVHYQRDPLHMKVFVAVLWVLNTCHEALSISGTYKYMNTRMSDPGAFLNGSPDLVLRLLFSFMVAVFSQGFLVRRIYIFSQKTIVPVIWIPLAIIQLVGAALCVGKALYATNGNIQVISMKILNNKSIKPLASLTFSIAAMADTLVAICMTCFLIRPARHRATQFPRMAHILRRVILFSVNTGVWTATFTLSTLILFHVFPDSVVYAVPGVPVCAIYCNTLLANLNARTYMEGGETTQKTEMDVFAHSNWYASDSTGTDRQQGVTKLTPHAQEASSFHELISYFDAGRLAASSRAPRASAG